MDVQKLLRALDNESNESIVQYTTKKIHEMNWKILLELHLNGRPKIRNLFKMDSDRKSTPY